MNNEVLELTKQMVAIGSVNPQDKELTESPYGESRMATFVADWLRGAGLYAEIQEVRPGRENVFSVAEGTDNSRTLLLTGHMDTVDVEGMSIESEDGSNVVGWGPVERGGRVYGRGACDDKGPLAVMMIAFRDRVRQGGELPCNLAFLGSCGEEYDMSGSKFCAAQLGGKLAAVVLAEPTDLKVVVAHKGVVRLKVVCSGKSAHSSNPESGKNAIYGMARALKVLEDYAGELRGRAGHPQLKSETLSATLISGGRQINIIPDRCETLIDWRILPGRSAQQCRDELSNILHERTDESIGVELINDYKSMESSAEDPVVKALLAAAEQVTGKGEAIAVGYATDASAFTELGIPTPIFGPGWDGKAHTQDEYIAIEQLEKGLAAYKIFLDGDWGLSWE